MSLFTAPMRRGLAWGLAAAIALPWLVGQAVKSTLQPGLHDNAGNASQMADFIVVGSMLFGLSMWLVAACACWIVAVMKGPQRHADAYPTDGRRPGA
jgi:uncharacterized membrane protein YedE/YeeE